MGSTAHSAVRIIAVHGHVLLRMIKNRPARSPAVAWENIFLGMGRMVDDRGAGRIAAEDSDYEVGAEGKA